MTTKKLNLKTQVVKFKRISSSSLILLIEIEFKTWDKKFVKDKFFDPFKNLTNVATYKKSNSNICLRIYLQLNPNVPKRNTNENLDGG